MAACFHLEKILQMVHICHLYEKLGVVNIKNIIFDLGGVILNIEPEHSLNGFSMLCGLTGEELRGKILENRRLFIDYETGRIDSSSFRKEVARIMMHEMAEFDFDLAWNSIIFDVPEERVRLLEQLRLKYRLFLLSNTNDLHAKRIDDVLATSTCASGVFGCFEKVYYSHIIHKRKPEMDAFFHVLEENDLAPSETLFIDDMRENIEAAKKTGMHVLHVEQNNPRLEFLLEG
jgi:glucose-1-phosphatase